MIKVLYNYRNAINLYLKLPNIQWKIICFDILKELAINAIIQSNFLQFFTAIITLLIPSKI